MTGQPLSISAASGLITRWVVGLAAVAGLHVPVTVFAQVATPPAGTVVTVNGVAISKTLVDRAVASATARGQADTPQLRKAITDELIARELLAQEAVRLKLDRSNEAKQQLAVARQNVLVELMLAEHMAKNPIPEAEIRAEFDRQVRMLEERGAQQQYRLRQITVAKEADAINIMGRIRKGESMEAIARQSSLAPSKEQGGFIDWISPRELVPAVSNVIVNLKAGTLAAAPIQTPSGWNIIRVEDVRSAPPPSFENNRAQVAEGLLREQRAAFIRKLRADAKLVE
jgi:peptidyl-prolyl cis-trans isomerase C